MTECTKYQSKKMHQKYPLMVNELKFAKDLLNQGITTIGNANCECTGLYYSAFTDLSQGLERLMKIIIILHNVVITGDIPKKGTITKQYEHNLRKLYMKCEEISSDLKVSDELGDKEVLSRILDVLDKFSTNDDGRYYNLDMIFCGNKPLDKLPEDCISYWAERVDGYLIEKHISKKKKEKQQLRSDMIEPILACNAIFHMTGEKGTILNSTEYLNSISVWELTGQLRRFFIAKWVRFLAKLLTAETNIIRALDSEIPYFDEIFRYYCTSDKCLRYKRRYRD